MRALLRHEASLGYLILTPGSALISSTIHTRVLAGNPIMPARPAPRPQLAVASRRHRLAEKASALLDESEFR
jgi:hypothetical protein